MNKNWKTSLAGLLGGLIIMFGPNVGGRLTGDQTLPPITLGNVLPGIVISVLGILSKDRNVTGGTVMQPTSSAVIVEKAQEQKALGFHGKVPLDPGL